MRRSIHVTRRLDAPPDAVFEVLADHGRYDRFAGIHRSEVIVQGDPAPNGLGAVRRIWARGLRFEEEITAYEPSARLDYLILDVRGLPFSHEGGSIRLSPDGDGTEAVWSSSFEIPIPVIGSAIDAILSRMLARGFVDVLDKSAEIAAERSPAAA